MSARLDQVTEAILERFAALWLDPDNPTRERTPSCFGNEGFDPPAASWVRLWVRSAGGGQETLGPKGRRKFRRPGFVIADIRTLPGKGQAPGQALGEAIRDIFEAERFGPFGLRFDDCSVDDIGEIEDGRWWASTATCRFEYEDTK